MKSVRQVVRGMLERALGHLADGPEPPPRLRETVLMFRVTYPAATASDWENFAIVHATDAYRSGFLRGLDWSMRELDEMDPDAPERLADLAAHDWSLADTIPTMREMLETRRDPNDFLGHLPPEERADVVDQLGRYFGGFRVVVVPEDSED